MAIFGKNGNLESTSKEAVAPLMSVAAPPTLWLWKFENSNSGILLKIVDFEKLRNYFQGDKSIQPI